MNVRSRAAAYFIALLAVVAVTAFRVFVETLGVDLGAPYLLFALGVLLAGWVGGLGPGLLATALSTAAVPFFFEGDTLSYSGLEQRHYMSMVLFIIEGTLISWLAGLLRRTNHNLRDARDQLEERVVERTRELQATNGALIQQVDENRRVLDELRAFSEQLQRSNRELQDFASVASHDLQEPLRKIQAFGDRLRVKCAPTFSDEGRDYLDRMQKAAGRMSVLINDLLTFSRVTTKAQPFQPTDLEQIAREVVSDLEVRIEQNHGRVEVGALPTVDADALQMRQLIQNLVSNALKFRRTEEPPVVRIRGSVDPSTNGHGDMAHLEIEDNGIGFEEKYLDRIFNIFQRLHGRGTYEGTGIGLAVCRKIVERHGGSITARSTPGQGSTFIIRIPVHHSDGENTTHE